MSDFLSDSVFQTIRDYIYSESGIHFSESNRSILESRLKERLRNLDIETPADYLGLLKRDKEETKFFLDAITTNLTRFFRNQAHYDTFIHYVIPDLVERKKGTGNHCIKIWSAGCSTGEEPYTLGEIGEKLHLSKERIRQLKDRALHRLRNSPMHRRLQAHLN